VRATSWSPPERPAHRADFPHWQFDGDDVLPAGLSDETVRRIMIDNPLATYRRLREDGEIGDNASLKETVR